MTDRDGVEDAIARLDTLPALAARTRGQSGDDPIPTAGCDGSDDNAPHSAQTDGPQTESAPALWEIAQRLLHANGGRPRAFRVAVDELVAAAVSSTAPRPTDEAAVRRKARRDPALMCTLAACDPTLTAAEAALARVFSRMDRATSEGDDNAGPAPCDRESAPAGSAVAAPTAAEDRRPLDFGSVTRAFCEEAARCGSMDTGARAYAHDIALDGPDRPAARMRFPDQTWYIAHRFFLRRAWMARTIGAPERWIAEPPGNLSAWAEAVLRAGGRPPVGWTVRGPASGVRIEGAGAPGIVPAETPSVPDPPSSPRASKVFPSVSMVTPWWGERTGLRAARPLPNRPLCEVRMRGETSGRVRNRPARPPPGPSPLRRDRRGIPPSIRHTSVARAAEKKGVSSPLHDDEAIPARCARRDPFTFGPAETGELMAVSGLAGPDA